MKSGLVVKHIIQKQMTMTSILKNSWDWRKSLKQKH